MIFCPEPEVRYPNLIVAFHTTFIQVCPLYAGAPINSVRRRMQGPGSCAAAEYRSTRSSAQGNCSAKSLAALVMSSILPCSWILPCPPCLPPVILLAVHGGSWGGSGQGGVWLGGSGQGGVWLGGGGGLARGVQGQGTFKSSCHILHYHMVLRPKGTSHNKWLCGKGQSGQLINPVI